MKTDKFGRGISHKKAESDTNKTCVSAYVKGQKLIRYFNQKTEGINLSKVFSGISDEDVRHDVLECIFIMEPKQMDRFFEITDPFELTRQLRKEKRSKVKWNRSRMLRK